VSILCYHTVDATWSSGLSMTPNDFRSHARWLARHRRVVDLATAIRLMDRRGRLPRGVTALTFDDGLTGVHEHALPVLRSLRLPATVFVVGRSVTGDRTVDWIDDPPPDDPLETLDPEQLRELVAAGIEIASHSHAHKVLPTLEPRACEEDLRTSREVLEELVRAPVPHLAYPRGRYDREVQAAAQRAGYSHAFALPEAAEAIGPYALPRVGVYRHNGTGALRTKSSPHYLRARHHPASVPVRAAAKAIRSRPRTPASDDAGDDATPAPASPPPAPRVAYLMSRFPKVSETFILNEILAVERAGVDVHVHPLLRERARVLHPGAAELVARAHYQPFLSGPILASQLWFLRHRPRRYLATIGRVLRGTAGSLNFTVGALGILPKVVHTARELERAGVDHVHCHFANHPALAGFAIHHLTGLPYSFTAHGSDLHVDRHMLPQKVADAAFVATISAYNRQVIVDECGPWAAAKVQVVRCGVDTEVFRPRPDGAHGGPLRLLCVGTIHEVKGQHLLLEAVSALRERQVPVSVTFVGDGPDRRALEQRARRTALGDVVSFLGETDRDGVLRELDAADVLVAPSVPTAGGKREGIPVVLMEAMACGLPVVSSQLSGIPELVEHDVSGLLLPPGDVGALTDTLARLADDAALRARLGAAARRRVLEAHDLDRNARQLVRLFAPRAAQARSEGRGLATVAASSRGSATLGSSATGG
jgi:colanic acid/amylovoran biosynthesis glycosyltransferase